jgi:hypothetical protein
MSSLLALNRVYRIELCWYFRPSLVNYCPSNILYTVVHLPPLCIFRGGLPAVKCGRKSDYSRSSVPARTSECYGAFMALWCQHCYKATPPLSRSCGSNTQHKEGSERHRQADRPPDPRVLFSPSRAPCYKSDATLTPVGTAMNN